MPVDDPEAGAWGRLGKAAMLVAAIFEHFDLPILNDR